MNYILIGITVIVVILIFLSVRSYFVNREHFTAGITDATIPAGTPPVTDPEPYKIEYMGLWKDTADERTFTSPLDTNFIDKNDLKNKVDTLAQKLRNNDQPVGYFALQYGTAYFEEASDKRIDGTTTRFYEKHGREGSVKTSIDEKGKTDFNYPLGGITINDIGGSYQNAVYRVTLSRDSCKNFKLPNKISYKLKEGADTILCAGEECKVEECADKIKCDIMDCAGTEENGYKVGNLKPNTACSDAAGSTTPCNYETCCTDNIPGASILSSNPKQTEGVSANAKVTTRIINETRDSRQTDTNQMVSQTMSETPLSSGTDTSKFALKSDILDIKKMLGNLGLSHSKTDLKPNSLDPSKFTAKSSIKPPKRYADDSDYILKSSLKPCPTTDDQTKQYNLRNQVRSKILQDVIDTPFDINFSKGYATVIPDEHKDTEENTKEDKPECRMKDPNYMSRYFFDDN